MEIEMAAQPQPEAAPVGLEAQLAAFAKETGQEGFTPPTETTPTQTPEAKTEPVIEPTQPIEAVATDVPVKFQTPEGTADLAKVEKSTVNAEAAIAKYREKERELRQLQNKVNDLQKQAPTIQQEQMPAPVNYAAPDLGQVTPQQIMEDLIQNGMSVDAAKQQATTLYKLAMIAQDTGYRRASQDLEQRFTVINERVQAESQQKELEAIAQSDPWVFSEDGLKTLSEIRQANPYLNHSDRPWQAAYEKHLANQYKQQRAGGLVKTPTPKAPAALVTPVGAAPTPEAAPQIDFANRASYETRLNKMSEDNALDLLAKELSRRGMKIKK